MTAKIDIELWGMEKLTAQKDITLMGYERNNHQHSCLSTRPPTVEYRCYTVFLNSCRKKNRERYRIKGCGGKNGIKEKLSATDSRVTHPILIDNVVANVAP